MVSDTEFLDRSHAVYDLKYLHGGVRRRIEAHER